MKNYNLLIIFLLISIISCNSEKPKRETDIENQKLKGKVRSYLRIIHRNWNNQNDTSELALKEVYRELLLFNKNGNIIEKRNFNRNGQPSKRWLSVYNSKEFKIEEFEVNYPDDTLQRWVNKFDNVQGFF